MLFILTLGSILCMVNSARILGSFTIPSYSHQKVYQKIWKDLALRGHELVVLTPEPLRDPSIPNLREIDLSFTKTIWHQLDFTNPPNGFKMLYDLIQTLELISKEQLGHQDVQNLIRNQSEHFDLFIVEWNVPLMYGLQSRFKCPMIGISAICISMSAYHALGNPYHPVITPECGLGISEDMVFSERVYVTIFSVIYYVFYYYLWLPHSDKLIENYIGVNSTPLIEIERNVSLIFINSNHFLNSPKPNVPALIEFSGLTIQEKGDLPQDLQAFLDNATEGAIYFSLGTNVRSNMLPSKLKRDIVRCFAQLPYKILWKFEDENLPGRPDNVWISKWLPQQDVLGHPNTKLFITQGGLQSLQEAVYSRVPLIGMPFISDQIRNVRKIDEFGIGISVDRNNFSTTLFKEAIEEVITNPKYSRNIEDLSRIIEDQPVKPLDKIVWWIEYVIRHKGAKHLHSPFADVSWFNYLLLDVVLFLLFIITFIIFIIKYICCKKNSKIKLE